MISIAKSTENNNSNNFCLYKDRLQEVLSIYLKQKTSQLNEILQSRNQLLKFVKICKK